MPALPISSSTRTSTSSPTATSTSTNTCDSSDNPQSHDSNVIAVGAGVGVSLGVCLIAAVAGLFAQRRMYRRRLVEHEHRLGAQAAFIAARLSPEPGSQEAAKLLPQELDSAKPAHTYELEDYQEGSGSRR